MTNALDRLTLLKDERIQRIAQRSGLHFNEPPPEQFVEAVRRCAEEWNRDRASRHKPGHLLYHYCDAPALMNILRSRAVWATSTKYLNDTTELLSFSFGMREHADKHRSSPAGETLADMVDFYWIAADSRQTQTIGMDRFASCFSTDGDLLSQWRAYGDSGRGYAIGFDLGEVAGLLETDPSMSLRRITYCDGSEADLIHDLIMRFAQAIADRLDVLDTTGWGTVHTRNWLSMRFGECLLQLLEEAKDPAFAEEKEWRIYGRAQNIQFRVSGGLIVPFQQLDLSSKERPNLLPIGEIVIGPRLEYAAAVTSLTTYGSTLGYGNGLSFRRSNVPFR